MDWKLKDRAKIYLDDGDNESEFKTSREFEVEIIVSDKFEIHDEVFVVSTDFDSKFGIEISEESVEIWTLFFPHLYDSVQNIKKYVGMRGSWVYVAYLHGGDSDIAGKRNAENACKICKRPNYTDVCACWWCGNNPF